MQYERRENRTIGRKYIVPYGLYRAHGFVSAPLAQRTGFSEADLAFLWDALDGMFDHDRSAARGEMAKRRTIIFKHASSFGNASAHALFDRVGLDRIYQDTRHRVCDPRTSNWPPARSFADYVVAVDREGLPGRRRDHRALMCPLRRPIPPPRTPSSPIGSSARPLLPAPVRADPCRKPLGGGCGDGGRAAVA